MEDPKQIARNEVLAEIENKKVELIDIKNDIMSDCPPSQSVNMIEVVRFINIIIDLFNDIIAGKKIDYTLDYMYKEECNYFKCNHRTDQGMCSQIVIKRDENGFCLTRSEGGYETAWMALYNELCKEKPNSLEESNLHQEDILNLMESIAIGFGLKMDTSHRKISETLGLVKKNEFGLIGKNLVRRMNNGR